MRAADAEEVPTRLLPATASSGRDVRSCLVGSFDAMLERCSHDVDQAYVVRDATVPDLFGIGGRRALQRDHRTASRRDGASPFVRNPTTSKRESRLERTDYLVVAMQRRGARGPVDATLGRSRQPRSWLTWR